MEGTVEGMVLALGYEGPASIGTLAAGAAIVVGLALLAWLVIRGLVLFFSDDRPHRPR